jgi:hypothetical protein
MLLSSHALAPPIGEPFLGLRIESTASLLVPSIERPLSTTIFS